MHPLPDIIDLHPSLGAYLLKYADRAFLTNALVQEEVARTRDAGIEHEPGLRGILGSLDIQDLRMLAYETAASNLRPSDPARDLVLRIDRDGVYQVNQTDIHLSKMLHTLRSLAGTVGHADPASIGIQNVSLLLGLDTQPLDIGAGARLHRKGSDFNVDETLNASLTRRHLALLTHQYGEFKKTTIKTKTSNRTAVSDMGIE